MPDEPIVPIDDRRLERSSESVLEIDDAVRALADQMFDVMDANHGAGLAAIQIGVPKRLIVMDVPDKAGRRHRLALVNPEILEVSTESEVNLEGCLSMPGYDLPVDRPARIRARYTDLSGKVLEIEADGILAICLQHEIDHVNGVRFTDRVSALRRSRARAYFAKVRRHARAA